MKKLALVIQPFYIGDIDNSKKNSTVKILIKRSKKLLKLVCSNTVPAEVDCEIKRTEMRKQKRSFVSFLSISGILYFLLYQ